MLMSATCCPNYAGPKKIKRAPHLEIEHRLQFSVRYSNEPQSSYLFNSARMKKITAILSFLLVLGGFSTQAQNTKSPFTTAQDKIGNVGVTITYNAPSMRGRAIFGDLVPYDKVWRAGADKATTITFTEDVMVAGQKVAAGKYAFFTMPKEEGNWPIMLNSESDQWGAYNMDASKNVLEAEATVTEIEPVETLKYSISDGMIHLDWATTRISFSVE